jgi:hypothetical protein
LTELEVVFESAAREPHMDLAMEEQCCGIVAAVRRGSKSICEGKQ